MKEKLTVNDIRHLIDGDPIAIFKDGWDEEGGCIYEDTPTFDQEKWEEMIKKYGDCPVRCISTSVNTTNPDWLNIAILI